MADLQGTPGAPVQQPAPSPARAPWGSLEGTLVGNWLQSMLGAVSEADQAAVHDQVQQATQQAEQSGQAYQQMAAAPQPAAPYNFLDQLAGNTASVLSQNPNYQKQAYERNQQEQKGLADTRAENLKALMDIYNNQFERAKQLGNVEAMMQSKLKVESLSKGLAGLLKEQGAAYTSDLETQRHGNRMDLQRLLGTQGLALEDRRQDGRMALEVLKQKGRLELEHAKPQKGLATPEEETAFENLVYTTGQGRQFVKLGGLIGTEKNKAIVYAGKLGIPALEKDEYATLDDLEAARDNLDAILSSVGDKLAATPEERPERGAANWWGSITQSDPDLAAFNTYWSNTVRVMRATAGSRGLRINRSEIERALRYDTILLTDTQEVAKQKIANIKRLLDNAESPLLDKDWRSNPQTRPTYNSIPPGGTVEIVTPDGRHKMIDVSDWPKAFHLGAARVYPGS